MRLITLGLSLTLLLAVAPPASASLPPQTEQIVAHYLTELTRVESARGRTSMERLFALTDTLREYLLLGESLDSTWSEKDRLPTIENISESDYADLCERLRGIMLNRDEVLIAQPDSGTFLPLAREKGLRPDRDFMDVYYQTVPSVWPAYIEQQTDYSGCGVYGTGTLVGLYGEWRRYRSEHPENYTRAATEQMGEIQNRLEAPNCACEGGDSVTRELQLFLSRFPSDPIAPKVREVLNAIKEGRSKIRFHCISG